MPIDFQKRKRELQELRDSSAVILQMQQDIAALMKENYDEDKIPPPVVGTVLLHMSARVGCALGMTSKQFANAAKEAFKAVAKELRG